MITRALLVFLVLAPVPFLLFGFLASFEPGTHWGGVLAMVHSYFGLPSQRRGFVG